MPKPEIVIILGASRSREKYGNKAVRAFAAQGHDVYPVNPHAEEIEGVKTYPSLESISLKQVDRISVYLPSEVGITMLEEIERLHPAEVWFNPGSESPELLEKAEELGLPVVLACSILDIGRSPTEFGN